MKWFKNVTAIEELRKQYRALLKKYHPDNPDGSVEAAQEINREYDRLFADLSRFSSESGECTGEEEKAGDKAFKAVLNEIVNFNMEIEIIGSWIWCFDCYPYRGKLKELGFKWCSRKKAWAWHEEPCERYRRGNSLENIRKKYGSKRVRNYACTDTNRPWLFFFFFFYHHLRQQRLRLPRRRYIASSK